MHSYKYLILGGGMTADAAARGIREVDPYGTIGLVGLEPEPPYNRPPLSKALWRGEKPESIWRGTGGVGVELHLGRAAVTLKPNARRVIDAEGAEYAFEKCLLATGGTPRKLPFGGEDVIYFRTVKDYRNLRELAQNGEHFTVIGGGFIGSEVAAALAMNGKEVTLIFPDEELCGRAFPADLARFVTDYFREKGVSILSRESVTGVVRNGPAFSVRTRSGRALRADGVVAGIGIQPSVDLAKAAGLAVDDGVEVDALCRTSNPDIYAAGDVASFFNPSLGKRIRVEHEDNANAMGRQAGRNMAGKAEAYDYLPAFYSDLFDLGYEAVGEIDARLETFADWKEPFREGVVYYRREGRVRGVLLWNVWGQVESARRLIEEIGPIRPEDLRGRLGSA